MVHRNISGSKSEKMYFKLIRVVCPLCIAACLFCLSACKKEVGKTVVTQIFDGNRQPPIAGADLYGFCLDSIEERGLLVANKEKDLSYDYLKEFFASHYVDSTPYCDSTYYKWHIMDCSDTKSEQFSTKLTLLIGDMDYFVQAYVKEKSGEMHYGEVKKVHTQKFKRNIHLTIGHANVFHNRESELIESEAPDVRGKYDLFCFDSDEVIDKDKDGFFCCRQENPDVCKYSKDDNTNLKQKTEWGYLMWYYGCGYSKMARIERPVMSYKEGVLTIAVRDDYQKIYYSIDKDVYNPLTFKDVYTEPLKIDKPCVVAAYAMSHTGYVTPAQYYYVTEEVISNR